MHNPGNGGLVALAVVAVEVHLTQDIVLAWLGEREHHVVAVGVAILAVFVAAPVVAAAHQHVGLILLQRSLADDVQHQSLLATGDAVGLHVLAHGHSQRVDISVLGCMLGRDDECLIEVIDLVVELPVQTQVVLAQDFDVILNVCFLFLGILLTLVLRLQQRGVGIVLTVVQSILNIDIVARNIDIVAVGIFSQDFRHDGAVVGHIEEMVAMTAHHVVDVTQLIEVGLDQEDMAVLGLHQVGQTVGVERGALITQDVQFTSDHDVGVHPRDPGLRPLFHILAIGAAHIVKLFAHILPRVLDL